MFNARTNNAVRPYYPSVFNSIQKARLMNEYFVGQYNEINRRLESIVQRSREISKYNFCMESAGYAENSYHGQSLVTSRYKVDGISIRSISDRISALFNRSSTQSNTKKRHVSNETISLDVRTRIAHLSDRYSNTRNNKKVRRETFIPGVNVRQKIDQLNRKSTDYANTITYSSSTVAKKPTAKIATKPNSSTSNVTYTPPVSSQKKLVPSFENQQWGSSTLARLKETWSFQLPTGYWNFFNTVTILSRYLIGKISSLYQL